MASIIYRRVLFESQRNTTGSNRDSYIESLRHDRRTKDFKNSCPLGHPGEPTDFAPTTMVYPGHGEPFELNEIQVFLK